MLTLLGLDLGTSATKCALVDENGRVLGHGRSEYAPRLTVEGGAFQNPDDYLRAVKIAVREAVESSRTEVSSISGIGVCGLAPVCIFLDSNLRPLSDAILWLDRRACETAEALRASPIAERILERSGNPIDAFYGLVKVAHELKRFPELRSECRYVVNAVGYVVLHLCGEVFMDYANAALYGIAFDIRKKCWDVEILKALGIGSDILPPLTACESVIGTLTRESAEILGLQTGIPVVAGTVDGSAACIASGIHEEGEAVITLGTSALLYVLHREPSFSGKLIEIPYIGTPEAWTSVGAMSCGGALLRYARDLWEIANYEEMEKDAEKIPPGSEGLLALPFFEGERTPIWEPHARGAFFGLSLSHGKGHYIRALMESVAFGLLHHLEILREHGIHVREPIPIMEGGARSRLWRQIVSDVLGLRLCYRSETMGAEYGAALLVRCASGVTETISRTDGGGKEFRIPVDPSPKYHEEYSRHYRNYRELVDLMLSQFQKKSGYSTYPE